MWTRPQQAPSDEVQVFYLGTRSAVDHTGDVLGERYELLELLGCGGTAAVYRALDERTKAKVAVKVLHASAKETIGAFFQQEGRLTARLRSPHLVRAHDFGEDEGLLFIVFDLLPGESLASLYFGQTMPWRELGQVVLQVLDALAVLHLQGIVHRDVKPDNVYLERKPIGDELHATLLDLGFALVPPERRLTNAPEPSRLVFGTEGFIAPELLAGCPPEPRNDLYSVGALMYTMLTAQHVPDIGACPEEMEIPSPRRFLPKIPQAIDDVVMRALSDVDDRFQSAAEMATALRSAILAAERGGESMLRALGEVETVGAKILGPSADAARSSASELTPSRGSVRGTTAVDGSGRTQFMTRGGTTRLVAACFAAGLVGAATTLLVTSRMSSSPTPTNAPATACADPAPAESLARVDRPAASSGGDGLVPGALARATPPRGSADAGLSRESGSAGASAIPARSANAPEVRRARATRAPPQKVTFEGVMSGLVPQARVCASRAEIAETPRSVRVRGDATSGEVASVRVVNMGQDHPFARCIAALIREARPPLREKDNAFTFFAEGGSP